MTSPVFLDRPDRPRIAFRFREGSGPALMFLPGYASDMTGTKALALDAWAGRSGRPMIRFDYAGCGESEGDFAAQSLADWRDDALALIDASDGPLVLVGSSMGGWLMLLVALARPERIAGLVGIAAAPDFTGWGFTQDEKMTILREGRLVRPGGGGDALTTSARFWQSGEANRLLHAPIAIGCPVRLLHGQKDDVVAWAWALKLVEQLGSADVQLSLVKDGDHRLSRDTDIRLLIACVGALMESL